MLHPVGLVLQQVVGDEVVLLPPAVVEGPASLGLREGGDVVEEGHGVVPLVLPGDQQASDDAAGPAVVEVQIPALALEPGLPRLLLFGQQGHHQLEGAHPQGRRDLVQGIEIQGDGPLLVFAHGGFALVDPLRQLR